MSQSHKGQSKSSSKDSKDKKDVPLSISRPSGAPASVRYAYLISYFLFLLALIYSIVFCTKMLRSVPYVKN